MEGQSGRCKIVVVGDAECGKTALLQVFAKDAYPGSYVPTVFENYTASFEIDKRRIELNMWDTSGSSYYDNVRPLAYPDSDAVLICFDISRPETLDSVLKKWQGETQEFCPNAKVVLVGCKLDMRTDLATLRELSKQRLIPVTHEQRKFPNCCLFCQIHHCPGKGLIRSLVIVLADWKRQEGQDQKQNTYMTEDSTVETKAQNRRRRSRTPDEKLGGEGFMTSAFLETEKLPRSQQTGRVFQRPF